MPNIDAVMAGEHLVTKGGDMNIDAAMAGEPLKKKGTQPPTGNEAATATEKQPVVATASLKSGEKKEES